MIKKFVLNILNWIYTQLDYAWQNFYFHWQLKNKKFYPVIIAFIFVIIAIPLSTNHLIKKKKLNRDINCLALNIYHESRGEPKAGQVAVAKVTLNRVKSKRYPNTICEVVYEKRWDRIRKRYVGAFSWTEFDKPTRVKSTAWYLAWNIAETVYKDKKNNQLKGALFFHANYIKPSWARKKKPVAKIGSHIFYR